MMKSSVEIPIGGRKLVEVETAADGNALATVSFNRGDDTVSVKFPKVELNVDVDSEEEAVVTCWIISDAMVPEFVDVAAVKFNRELEKSQVTAPEFVVYKNSGDDIDSIKFCLGRIIYGK